MAFYVRRRYNLRFLFILSLIIIFSLFILLLTQFGQMEKSIKNDQNIRDKYKNRVEQVNAERDRLRRIENLNNRVANRYYLNRNNENGGDLEFKTEFTKTMKSLQRLVHLDLKGSPPKLSYFKEFIPYIKKAGATGVIIEYEDYFPYKGDIESIKNQNHYTNNELSQLFDLLKQNQLTLIPLIQTYGHLEFVLKLKEFAYLRENSKHYQVITPCSNDTYNKVLFKMIDQIIEAHPEELEYIHIGGDEVYHINVNPACSSLPHLKNTQDFFIYHLTILIDYIKLKRPNLSVMIWEDMIRKNMLNNIDQKFKTFAKRIVPVVWNYKPVVEIDESIWPKYDDLFSEIWFASAFKGATKSSELIPNTQLHYENHLSWIQIIRYFPSPHKIKGIILTGWSRYDHMVPICEILPAGIPSLTLCLQTLINYNEEEDFIFSKSKEFTKCNYKQSPTGFIMDPTKISYKNMKYKYNKLVDLYKCEFPGSNIYNWLLGLKLTITNFEKIHSNYIDRLSKYNINYKLFNSMDFERAKTEFYPNYRELFEKFKQTGETSFDKYFYADLNEELINIYIIKYIDLIDETLANMNKTSLPENAPVRPFNKIVQSML